MMTYTVWSKGREVGHSTLAFACGIPNLRAGWFHPTDVGTSLMSIITGERDAWLAFAVAWKNDEHSDLTLTDEQKATIHADIAAATARAEALQLELRGPDGRVIPVEDIHMRDVELFIPEIHGNSDGDEITIEDLSGSDRECAEELVRIYEALPDERPPWVPPPEVSRYQIQVTLHHEMDIP